jgi:hypothetical protein
VAAGLVLGVIASIALTGVLQAQLFGVSARDPWTLMRRRYPAWVRRVDVLAISPARRAARSIRRHFECSGQVRSASRSRTSSPVARRVRASISCAPIASGHVRPRSEDEVPTFVPSTSQVTVVGRGDDAKRQGLNSRRNVGSTL